MRQHVNPLSSYFQQNRVLPQYENLFKDYSLPLHLDLGCARGKFLIELAMQNPDLNFLGLEIREKLVEKALRDKEMLEINNLNFIFCNANVSLEDLFAKLPDGKLKRISIQFPDPCFKRRHRKRRLIQPSLIFLIANYLEIGSELFIQSDVLSVFDPIIYLVKLTNCFYVEREISTIGILSNPYNVSTEREDYAMRKGYPIFRSLFFRNENTTPSLSLLEEKYSCLF